MFKYEVEVVKTYYGNELEITNYNGEVIGYASSVNAAEKMIEDNARKNRITHYNINYKI